MTPIGRDVPQATLCKKYFEGMIEASRVEDDVMWVKMPSERRCGSCGVVVERWVLHNKLGHRVAKATFCSVCYPDFERIFHTPEAVRDAA